MDIKKSRKFVFLLPNLVTCSSLVLGFCAILLAIQGNFTGACLFVLISSNLDFIDGKIAKITNSTSEFGGQLDSMTDMVVFGVAPALIAWLWGFDRLGHTITIISVLFVMMTAFRLSRFNLDVQGKEKKNYFQGLPSPVAAILVCSFVLLAEELSLNLEYSSVALVVTCVVSGLLMVSNLRYPHRYTPLITALGILLFVISNSILPVFLITLSYTLLIIPFRLALLSLKKRRARRTELANL